MLYREIISVCSQIHTKHTNSMCGQNTAFLNVYNLVVHKASIRLYIVQTYVPCVTVSILLSAA